MLRSNYPRLDGIRRHISLYLQPNDRKDESKFNMMYPTVLFIVITAFYILYAKDDRFKTWFDRKIKKIQEYVTSLETNALLEETTHFGRLLQGNSVTKNLLEDLDVLPQSTIELKYERTLKTFGATEIITDTSVSGGVDLGVPDFGVHLNVNATVESRDLGNRQLGKDTVHPMNKVNLNCLCMPGLDKHGITKSNALAAAQQIAQSTGSIEMATIFLANAAIPTRRIRDIFGDEQNPWVKGDLPDLKSEYDGTPQEVIACSTIVEGLIQMHLGESKFKDRFEKEKGPSWSPLLFKFGIPHEKGIMKFSKESKEILLGNQIGKGRKVRLLKLDKDLYYTVETHKLIFCRRIQNQNDLQQTIVLAPEIRVYSTSNFANGHYTNGFAKIQEEVANPRKSKFKVL